MASGPVDPTDLAAELHARADEALAAGDLAGADELVARALELFASADPAHPDVANALVLRARSQRLHRRSRITTGHYSPAHEQESARS